MNEQTEILINSLRVYKLKKQVVNLINNTHDRVKNEVLSKGITLNAFGHQFEDEVVAYQIITSQNKTLVAFYGELNYIKRGLTKEWIPVIGDERYEIIRQEVENIFNTLE